MCLGEGADELELIYKENYQHTSLWSLDYRQILEKLHCQTYYLLLEHFLDVNSNFPAFRSGSDDLIR